MKHYLGVDVGTYETKGVIVTAEGQIVAQGARAAPDDRAAAGLGGA